LFAIWLFLAGRGIYDLLERVKSKKVRMILMAGVFGVYLVSYGFFINYYYGTGYSEDQNGTFRPLYTDVAAYRENHPELQDYGVVYPYRDTYYLFTYKIDPFTTSRGRKGVDRYGDDIINTVEFPTDWTIHLNKDYVLWEGDYRFERLSGDLLNLGYESVKLENYTYFLNPFRKYEFSCELYKGNLDKVAWRNGELTVSGWSLDAKGTPYESFYLEIDGVTYEYIPTQRQDVANAFDDESVLFSGFEIQEAIDFPLSGERDIALIGVTNEGIEEKLIGLSNPGE
jgi:hypothetical protein